MWFHVSGTRSSLSSLHHLCRNTMSTLFRAGCFLFYIHYKRIRSHGNPQISQFFYFLCSSLGEWIPGDARAHSSHFMRRGPKIGLNAEICEADRLLRMRLETTQPWSYNQNFTERRHERCLCCHAASIRAPSTFGRAHMGKNRILSF